jgi:phospholipid/cholesterol/gamma-HCH transport system ATP-binding protein
MTAPQQDLVEISDLHFAFGALQIFRGLTLKIPRGKMVAILGGSGSGKSTLLKLIGGQLKPQKGRIRVDGRVVHELDTAELYALRRKMGMMFQVSGLFSDLTVYENIAFALREHYDLPEEIIRPLVLMKLDAVGLRGARDMRPGDLSGGMTRRVALARAIATDPMLTMYDEPFAGLDPITLNVGRDADPQTQRCARHDVDHRDLRRVGSAVARRLSVCDRGGAASGRGRAESAARSEDPYLKQFLHALPDGPVRFHFPGRPLGEELGLATPSPTSG